MLTTRYHIGSIIAIFFALGIGILIGGTLGQRWMHQTEDSIVRMLMLKYDEQVAANQLMQKQIGSLQLLNRAISPIFNQKRIVWLRSRAEKNEVLAMAMKSAGAEWIEKNSDKLEDLNRTKGLEWGVREPDIIIVSDPRLSPELNESFSHRNGNEKAEGPKVIDISDRQFKLNEPEDVVNLILYLKRVVEEEDRETIGFYRYPGVE